MLQCVAKNTLGILWVPGVEVKTRVGAQMLCWLYSIESPFSPSSAIAALVSTIRTFSLFEKIENAILLIFAWFSITFVITFFLVEIARLASTVCPLSHFPHNVPCRPFRIEGRFCCYLLHFLLLLCASVVNSNQICVRASLISPGMRFSSSFCFLRLGGPEGPFLSIPVFFVSFSSVVLFFSHGMSALFRESSCGSCITL